MVGAFIFAILAIVLIILGILAILIVRQAAVVILIALSPLAFAMALLPNTKPLFDKWRKAFMAMLVLFPTISALFGGAALAAGILGKVADQNHSWFLTIAAFGILFVPLIAFWPVMKASLNGLGKIGGYVSGKMSSAGKYGMSKNRDLASKSNARLANSGTKMGKVLSGGKLGRRSVLRGNTLMDKANKEKVAAAAYGFKNRTNDQKKLALEGGKLGAADLEALSADKGFLASLKPEDTKKLLSQYAGEKDLNKRSLVAGMISGSGKSTVGNGELAKFTAGDYLAAAQQQKSGANPNAVNDKIAAAEESHTEVTGGELAAMDKDVYKYHLTQGGRSASNLNAASKSLTEEQYAGIGNKEEKTAISSARAGFDLHTITGSGSSAKIESKSASDIESAAASASLYTNGSDTQIHALQRHLDSIAPITAADVAAHQRLTKGTQAVLEARHPDNKAIHDTLEDINRKLP